MPFNGFTPEMKAFLERPLYAVLATINPNGTPQQTPVWFEFHDPNIWISTDTDRQKGKNLLRDPKVSIYIEDEENHYKWLSIQGRAEMIREGGHDLIERLAVKYMGEKEGRPYAEKMKRPERVIFVIHPQNLLVRGF